MLTLKLHFLVLMHFWLYKCIFEGIVHQNKHLLNIDSHSGHSRLGWVCFFIRFVEMCLCISVSAMDALQWMGAVRMRVQTADKNITIIHTTPVHQLTSGEDKSWNNSSIKTFLNFFNHWVIIHNNSSSSEKVHLL